MFNVLVIPVAYNAFFWKKRLIIPLHEMSQNQCGDILHLIHLHSPNKFYVIPNLRPVGYILLRKRMKVIRN